MKRLIIAISLISLIFLGLSSLFFYKKDVNAKVNIGKGLKTIEIAQKLEDENVILNKYLFVILALIKDQALRSGVYEFKGKYSVIDVYEKMAKGEIKQKFTIIPGEDLIDIANKLEKEGIVKKEEFLKYVFDEKNVRKYELVGSSFEGYFPPESYAISEKETVETLIKKFLKVFEKRYLPYKQKVESKDYSVFYEKNLSFYEAMIIASMIEKETYHEEEKPIIAGVIFNRLKSNMRLQIDPTVIYALKLVGSWDGKLNKSDLVIDSPFNTYKVKGLPPTPICSFTISSLEAVLNPTKSNYYYYVLSKDRKRHIFSEDYETHLKNIKENLK
jgi:UPF0755 protein